MNQVKIFLNKMKSIKIYLYLFLLCIVNIHTIFGQEIINVSRYEFSTLAVNSNLSVIDPLNDEEVGDLANIKQDRKFRVELFYNRNNHSDRINSVYWKLDVTLISNLTGQSEILKLEFSKNNGLYSSWADFTCPSSTPNISNMTWRISNILMQKDVAGNGSFTTTTNVNDLPLNDIHLEAMALNDRMVIMDYSRNTPKLNLDLTTSEVRWDHVYGAVEYDLEWVFIDDNDLTNFTYNSSQPQGPFDFKEPVRITTNKTYFPMDLIYPKGTIYFRVRPKGYFHKISGDKEIYSYDSWYYTTKSTSSNIPYVVLNDFEGLKNWQYSVVYAENGFSKSTINYLDGTLRSREQLTKMKSTNQVVASATLFDSEGKSTIQVIPTPIVTGSLNYFNQLHRDANGNEFDKNDFDYGISNPLGTSTGAGQYYSSNNPFLNDPFRDRIPDAEGYPYIQTKYINDNTGRVSSTSGVGKTLKLGNGHDNQFFYVKPSERELRELFGSNVGDATHYDKTIMIDQNGQGKVQYTDSKGRVIASGLYANNPDNLLPIDNNTITNNENVGSNLMGNNIITEDALGNKKSVVEYYHMNIGANSITLSYNLVGGSVINDPIFGAGNCASCFYKLTVKVFDPQGNQVNLAYNSQTDNLPLQLYPEIYERYSASQINCNSTSFNPGLQNIISTVNLTTTGEYKIYKELSVDVDAVNNYLANTALNLSGAPNLTSILNSYTNNVITSGCGFDCADYYDQECRQQLGLPLSGILTTTQQSLYDSLLQTKCSSITTEATNDINSANADGNECDNILDILKLDVSPNGWVFDEDDTWRNNTSNWNIPLTRTDGTTYNPAGSLQNLEDNWDDNFANQLWQTHPEKCFYQKCTDIANLKEYNQTLTNISSWANALSLGYINNTGDFITTPDPIYTSSIYNSTINTFTNRITNFNNSGYSIYQYLLHNPNQITDQNGNVISSTVIPQSIYYDRVWNLMKTYYLGERFDYMEENYPNCSYYNNPNANFVSSNTTLSDDMSGVTNPAFDPTNASGPEICNSNVAMWMQSIQDDCPSLTQTQLNTISYNLQNYCITDYNSFANSTGSIQLSDITTNANLIAVQNILQSSCNTTLVSMSTNDGCANPITTSYSNILQLSTATSKNIALLSSLAANNYYTFINSPAITEIPYQTSWFSINHWNSNNMTIELKDGTTLLNTLIVNTISEISIVNQTIIQGSPSTLKIKVKVQFLNGNINYYWITNYNIKNDKLNILNFNVSQLSLNTFTVTTCNDESSNDFEVNINLQLIEDGCVQDIYDQATIMGQQDYNEQKDNFLNGIKTSFSSKCFSGTLNEFFTLSYPRKEYAFTLYYYDQADNLVQTVPPQGVKIVASTGFNANNAWTGLEPTHLMKTINTFNSVGNLTKNVTPDQGTSSYYYNSVQQIRFSQNDEQSVPVAGYSKYSYIKYDNLGRTIEAGVAKTTSIINEAALVDNTNYPNATVSVPTTEVVLSKYDNQPITFDEVALGWKPTNLLNRISTVMYYDSYTGDIQNYNNAVFYSYDITGNVKKLLSDNRKIGTTTVDKNIRYKVVDYVFDIYSGKVKEVWYQKNKQDQFGHKYKYDDDSRLVSAFTSKDGVKWDEDASYYYYLSGPLARVDLGETKVQGIDFAYTLQGWLKGVNSNTVDASRDLGNDGFIVDETGLTSVQKMNRKRNRWMAQDAFGYSLTYFNTSTEKDYKSISTSLPSWIASNEDQFLPATGTNLYNGAIRSMVTALKDLNEAPISIFAKVYKYDQMYRLKESNTFAKTNVRSDNSWTGVAQTNAYKEMFEYDLNGNITKQQRNGSGIKIVSGIPTVVPFEMENLQYYYNTSSTQNVTLPIQNNQLASVVEILSNDSDYNNDINSGQLVTTDNYGYDKIGRIVSDKQEKIQTITWSNTNKVKTITYENTKNTPDLEFVYNPFGIRIAKIVKNKIASGSIFVINTNNIQTTYYSVDATGNTLATYSSNSSSPSVINLVDHTIYGASRIGTVQPVSGSSLMQTTPNFNFIEADNRASAIIEINASTFTAGQSIVYKIGTTALNTAYVWQSTLATNVNALIDAINANSIKSDISASLWWYNNTTGSYYIYLKYEQSGNFNSKSLGVYINGSATASALAAHVPKRVLSYGGSVSAKGKFQLCTKQFELTNHLGSVLAVITDRKTGTDDGVYNQNTGAKTSGTLDNLVDYYQPDILSYSDYSAFGTMLDGRNSQIDKYRYGYQGSEKDDEIKGGGNSYTTEFRMLDPRLGRWLSIDPLSAKYPGMSPYNSMNNNPITTNDIKGLEGTDWIKKKGSNIWEYHSGVQSQAGATARFGEGTQYKDDGETFSGSRNGQNVGTVTLHNGGLQTYEGGSYVSKDINPNPVVSTNDNGQMITPQGFPIDNGYTDQDARAAYFKRFNSMIDQGAMTYFSIMMTPVTFGTSSTVSAIVGGGSNLMGQLASNGGRWDKVDVLGVASATATGFIPVKSPYLQGVISSGFDATFDLDFENNQMNFKSVHNKNILRMTNDFVWNTMGNLCSTKSGQQGVPEIITQPMTNFFTNVVNGTTNDLWFETNKK
jgi:RHS repeat-associated protein